MQPHGLSSAQAQRVRERVALECERAAALLGIELPPPDVKLDLSGTTAGMFCRQGSNEWLRFNPWLFAKEFDRHLYDTVIHEVCHYAIYRLLGGQRRIKPHGPEWQGLMTALGPNPRQPLPLIYRTYRLGVSVDFIISALAKRMKSPRRVIIEFSESAPSTVVDIVIRRLFQPSLCEATIDIHAGQLSCVFQLAKWPQLGNLHS